MTQNMVEHHAAVTVDAPIHQVYSLFSHFNDFPKFMSFVKEVTYHDDQRSHWVADVAGHHEWDAVNEDWIPDRQIGWRSFNGLENYGRVQFQPVSAQQTHIDVYVNYTPPAGFLGSIGERMGAGKRFDDALQHDLNHFGEMVHQAPVGALDPASSTYLFHSESAAAQGTTTERQNATMEEGRPVTASGSDVAPTDVNAPVRDDYAEDYTTRSDTGVSAQGVAPTRDDTSADRPVLDRDIIREPGGEAPLEGQQAGMQGGQAYPGQRGTNVPPSTPENEPELPPEQIPRWDRPEGDQPQR